MTSPDPMARTAPAQAPDGIDWTRGRLGALAPEDGPALDAADLRAAVRARAEALAAAGLRAGHVLAVTRPAGPGPLVDLLAAWRLGAAAAMLDPALTAPERAAVAGRARAALAVAEDGALAPGHADPRAVAGMGQDRAALILFTSGTTGTPKGVVLSHRAISARIALNIAQIGDGALSRTLLTLPLHFGHGLIGVALTTLAAGGTLILPRPDPAPAFRLGRLLDAAEATFLSSVPTLWRVALRAAAPPARGTLRRVHVGSAPLTAELWAEIAAWAGAPVWNCYGITETANWIAGAPGPAADGHVGRPWGGSLAVSEAGEVLVRSPALMEGYLDDPDATAAVLAGGWYATGDGGALDASGALTLAGRLKDEINVGGTKVQPADVDAVLERHPAVAEACAFALPDPVSGERVGAAYVPVPGADPDDLAQWCAARLRPVARPARLIAVEAIPRTPRGKVSRRAVAAALAPS